LAPAPRRGILQRPYGALRIDQDAVVAIDNRRRIERHAQTESAVYAVQQPVREPAFRIVRDDDVEVRVDRGSDAACTDFPANEHFGEPGYRFRGPEWIELGERRLHIGVDHQHP
jgi:hypothetical protein